MVEPALPYNRKYVLDIIYRHSTGELSGAGQSEK